MVITSEGRHISYFSFSVDINYVLKYSSSALNRTASCYFYLRRKTFSVSRLSMLYLGRLIISHCQKFLLSLIFMFV